MFVRRLGVPEAWIWLELAMILISAGLEQML